MSARSRDSVRFNDNLASSLANELMMANNSALVDIQLDKDEDKDYEKLLQSKSKQFFIGRKVFDFDPHEQIFFLRDTIKTQRPLANCRACGNETKEKKLIQNPIYCDFCSFQCCKDCGQKERPYPLAKPENGKRKRGTICKLCDRKFFFRPMYE